MTEPTDEWVDLNQVPRLIRAASLLVGPFEDDGESAPTLVAVALELAGEFDGITALALYRDRDAVNDLIDGLIRSRDQVWPPAR